jgi:hypothetical protein
MKQRFNLMLALGALGFFCCATLCRGEIKIAAERLGTAEAGPGFRFKQVPPPAKNDAAAKATLTLVEGRRDANGGPVLVLQDGTVPADEDAPADNFFFRAGSDGGRVLVDLGGALEIRQVNTYSWHPGTRGPQVYQLYAGDGTADGFNPQPKRGTDPESCGWQRLAAVDTRPKSGEMGGQYGVSLSDSAGVLGTYRYLLFDMSPTEKTDPFGNTFYSEIDVLDRNGPAVEAVEASVEGPSREAREVVETEDGKYKITIDTSEAPDLTAWARAELAPVARAWYPKLVRLLPSEGFEAPASLSIIFSKTMRGVAGTSGTRIRCSARWIRQNLKGEALGSIVHEMVHVVQQYGRARRANPQAAPAPGWLTEGLTDYIRWYLYEPQSHGAEISARNLANARYNASYRVSANFLNWIAAQQGPNFIADLNAALRQGAYAETFWKERTGRTPQELEEAWKKDLQAKLP